MWVNKTLNKIIKNISMIGSIWIIILKKDFNDQFWFLQRFSSSCFCSSGDLYFAMTDESPHFSVVLVGVTKFGCKPLNNRLNNNHGAGYFRFLCSMYMVKSPIFYFRRKHSQAFLIPKSRHSTLRCNFHAGQWTANKNLQK